METMIFGKMADPNQKMRRIRRNLASRQAELLLAGLLALPSAISGAGFSVDNWERAVVSSGATHNSILTTPVDTSTRPTHNLSGMTGATAATYEFVVNVPQTDQFSPVLLAIMFGG